VTRFGALIVRIICVERPFPNYCTVEKLRGGNEGSSDIAEQIVGVIKLKTTGGKP
jgi:hypothetical protein